MPVGLKLHVPLLAFAHFQRRAVENLERLRQCGRRQFRQRLVRQHQHGIAGQDGRVGVPFGVDRGLAPAERSRVHDVVVNQGKVVEQLNGVGPGKRGAWVSAAGLGTQQHQNRTQPLAAQIQQITLGGVESVRRTVECGPHEFLGQIIRVQAGQVVQLLHGG